MYACVCVSARLQAEMVDAKVVAAGAVVELPALKGREKLGSVPLYVLVEFEGE